MTDINQMSSEELSELNADIQMDLLRERLYEEREERAFHDFLAHNKDSLKTEFIEERSDEFQMFCRMSFQQWG